MTTPETLHDYLTRKTGFGRTHWFWAILIALFIILWLCLSITNYPEPWWWVPGAIAVGMFAIVIGGTLHNWKTDRARAAKPPLNNHYTDVCEGCDPLRMADGKPITDLLKWYAASKGIDRRTAKVILDTMGMDESYATKRAHYDYLRQFDHKP